MRTQASDIQQQSITAQKNLLDAYTAYNKSDAKNYTDKDVTESAKLFMTALKSNANTAKKQLGNNRYAVHVEDLIMKELHAYIDDTPAVITAKNTTAKNLKKNTAQIDDAHRQKVLNDGRASLKFTVDNANNVLAASDGKVDDNAVREDLKNAIDTANLASNDINVINADIKTLNDKVKAVQDAVQAQADRIAAEQAAAAAAAAYYGGGSGSPAAGSSGGSAYNGYTVGGVFRHQCSYG